MAPGKKKKKAAANPTRGFATVSLPSRASVARNEDDPGSEGVQTDGGHYDGAAKVKNLKDERAEQRIDAAPSAEIQTMSPEQLEEHLKDAELQSMLDEHGPRCKAEAARQVARLEAERRMLRLQATKVATSPWLPDLAVNEILKASSLHDDTDHPSSDTFAQNSVIRSETELVLRLWTLQQILTRLLLPAVDEALQHVLNISFGTLVLVGKEDVWGLLEALEWYALRSEDYDLPNYDFVVPRARKEVEYNVSDPTNGENKNTGLEKAGAHDQNRLPVTGSSKVPMMNSRSTQNQPLGSIVFDDSHEIDQELSGRRQQKSRPESVSVSESETQSDSEDDSDPSQLIHTYLQIKSSLLSSQQGGDEMTISDRRHRRLLNRLNRIERDILFDEEAAATAWRNLQPKLLADLADQRLVKGLETPAAKHGKQDGRNLPQDLSEKNEDAIGLEDMFIESPSISEADRDNPIQIIDFGSWSGVHPRRLLEELCKLRDAHCQIALRLISLSSYAIRHSVSIKWSSEQTIDDFVPSALPSSVSHGLTLLRSELDMRSIAASTKTQSEAYICTISMFAVAAQDPRGQKMSLRLPPVWRGLWTELMDSRRKGVDDFDKSILKRMQSLLSNAESSQGVRMPPSTLVAKTRLSDQPGGNRPCLHSTTTLDASQVEMEWTRRSARPAFQIMLRTRKDLPIFSHKDDILQTIKDQAITIICAETGAGKSTQVPSYILERELSCGRDCRILVTQPRRISAITLAKRVSQELGEKANDLGSRESLVGYAIRLESKTSVSTKITFATTGVLLRMIESSPNLDELDYVVLDEVHERTMDVDLLFIALRQVLLRRSALKIVLMSATIDAQKLSDYFGGAPYLDIVGRTYPVEVHYLEQAIEDTVDYLVSRRSRFQPDADNDEDTSDIASREKDESGDLRAYSSKTRAFLANYDEYRIDYDLIARLLYVIAAKQQYLRYSTAILVFVSGIAEIRRLHSMIMSDKTFQSGWIVHLLHSSLPTDDLERAFAPPPKGIRKIVIATNIAETGITIPDVTAVIDTCKEKVMRFDERRQISKLVEGFISRSSSRQRRGRAARVAPGLCFHLVTKYRYENLMTEQHVPEMLRLSLQDPILRVKIWGLGDIEETLGAAIEPPTTKNIRRAISALKDVGALTNTEDLTPLGRQLARLPLDVELGKLAILGIVFKCLDAAVTIVSILSSKSPFQVSRGDHGSKEHGSDLLSTYIAYQGWKKTKLAGTAAEFCRRRSLSEHNLVQIEEQKVAILVALVDARLVLLDEAESSTLRAARHRRDFVQIPLQYETASESADAICSVIAMAFYPKLLGREGKHWRNVFTNQQINASRLPTTTVGGNVSRCISFYQAMQAKSGHLNVSGTAAVPESAMLLLLGQAEFRFYSGVVKVDGGRIQLGIRDWRTMLALKILRREISFFTTHFLSYPGSRFTAKEEKWFDIWLAAVNGRAEQRIGAYASA